MVSRHLQAPITPIRLDKLELWREGNVRKSNVFMGIEDLAKNILENGLLVPLLVTRRHSEDKYWVISGQRRLEACRLINYDPVECIDVKEISVDDARLLSLSENLYRLEMDPEDISDATDSLYKLYKDIGKVARRLGVSDSTVRTYLKYRNVPEELKELVRQKKINKSQAIRIYTQFPDLRQQIEIANELARIKKRADRGNFYRAIKKSLRTDDARKIRKLAKRLARMKRYEILLPPEESEVIEKTAKELTMKGAEVITEILERWIEDRLRRGLPLID